MKFLPLLVSTFMLSACLESKPQPTNSTTSEIFFKGRTKRLTFELPGKTPYIDLNVVPATFVSNLVDVFSDQFVCIGYEFQNHTGAILNSGILYETARATELFDINGERIVPSYSNVQDLLLLTKFAFSLPVPLDASKVAIINTCASPNLSLLFNLTAKESVAKMRRRNYWTALDLPKRIMLSSIANPNQLSVEEREMLASTSSRSLTPSLESGYSNVEVITSTAKINAIEIDAETFATKVVAPGLDQAIRVMEARQSLQIQILEIAPTKLMAVVDLQLFDINGRIVWEQSIPSASLPVNLDIPVDRPGTYRLSSSAPVLTDIDGRHAAQVFEARSLGYYLKSGERYQLEHKLASGYLKFEYYSASPGVSLKLRYLCGGLLTEEKKLQNYKAENGSIRILTRVTPSSSMLNDPDISNRSSRLKTLSFQGTFTDRLPDGCDQVFISPMNDTALSVQSLQKYGNFYQDNPKYLSENAQIGSHWQDVSILGTGHQPAFIYATRANRENGMSPILSDVTPQGVGSYSYVPAQNETSDTFVKINLRPGCTVIPDGRNGSSNRSLSFGISKKNQDIAEIEFFQKIGVKQHKLFEVSLAANEVSDRIEFPYEIEKMLKVCASTEAQLWLRGWQLPDRKEPYLRKFYVQMKPQTETEIPIRSAGDQVVLDLVVLEKSVKDHAPVVEVKIMSGSTVSRKHFIRLRSSPVAEIFTPGPNHKVRQLRFTSTIDIPELAYDNNVRMVVSSNTTLRANFMIRATDTLAIKSEVTTRL